MASVLDRPRTASLDRLLRPRSVAIVGASDKEGALGNSVLANLVRHSFPGDIHLVNPKRETIYGRPCLPSITALPDGVDAAVLAIPGPAVLDALRALAAKAVGAAVIFSAGFAEGGEEGQKAQAEVARIAAKYGMVIEGPNCLGLINYIDGVPLTFVETPPHRCTGPGIGIVSQSGAMAVVLGTMLMAKALPITISVSTGNEAASGVEDYVEHLLANPQTTVIGMIVEQFRAPARFLALAERVREAGKRIVLLHPGTSSAARESAATHTGAMAGDFALMRAKVQAAGVVLVPGLEELGDVLDIAFRCGDLPEGGIALLTESGAYKALALDLAEDLGLPLPQPGPETATALRATIPDFIGVSNPMDVTAQALVDPDLYRRTLVPLLADPAYSTVVLGIIQTDLTTSALKFPPIIEAIRALKPDKPVLFAGLDEGADVPPASIIALRDLGVPYFPAPYRAFRALAALRSERVKRTPVKLTAIDLPLGGVIPEYRAKQALRAAGISFPEGRFAATLDEAADAATALGFPVAVKAQAAALSHKSDAGGVALNVADVDAVRTAWTRIHANVAAHAPSVQLDGVLIERMGPRGLELIVGAKSDPEWGSVILVGFGGVQAEILKDVRLLVPGLSKKAIVSELMRLKSAPLLLGWRGSPALDVGSVADVVIALSQVLAGTPAIREIDLNLVVVYPEGRGCIALDALILAD